MRQNLLGVFESLGHFGVLAVKGCCQWVLTSLALEIDVCDEFLFRRQDNLRLVSEVDLDNLVTQPEHDGMLGLHPLLDIDIPGREIAILVFDLVLVVEIVAEVLEESDFFHEFTLLGI